MHQLLSSIAFLCLFALPLAAQEEALHGTWEGTFADSLFGELTIRLSFEEGGAFETSLAFAGDLLFADAPEMREVFPSIEEISVHGTGTYEVAGDSLWTEINETNWFVNDTDFLEFFTPVLRDLARALADASGVSEEDYPAFEQEFVDNFLSFDEAEVPQNTHGTYAIEGDTLFITTTYEDGSKETLEFHRVDVASAVVGITWGGLKAAWRP